MNKLILFLLHPYRAACAYTIEQSMSCPFHFLTANYRMITDKEHFVSQGAFGQ